MSVRQILTLSAWFPFCRWFPASRQSLRADLVAGITVAVILVPQSMAYAQLAGLPVVYGLYASLQLVGRAPHGSHYHRQQRGI